MQLINISLHLYSQLAAEDAGLGGEPPPETVIILGLGVFLGSIVQGITGFGTAILHLAVWVVAGALGFDSGPLKLAVICCSCAMAACLIPMFFLAHAKQYAIKPLAISVPLGKALAAPFGAMILKFLPARQLEGIVSVLMLLIMALMNRDLLCAWALAAAAWLSAVTGLGASKGASKRKGASFADLTSLDGDDLLPLISSNVQQQQQQQEGHQHEAGLVHSSSQGRLVSSADCTCEDIGSCSLCSSQGSSSSSSLVSSLGALQQGSTSGYSTDEQPGGRSDRQQQQQQQQLSAAWQPPADGVVLIHSGDSDSGGSALDDRLALPETATADTTTTADPPTGASAVTQEEGEQEADGPLLEPALMKHGFWGLFGIGTVTGLAAGLLTGATGIGGPPMMVMYAYLECSKKAVRGTSATISLVQDQIIGYVIFGLIRWQDRYGCYDLAVMTCLMGLCFVLMSASALGCINVG